MISINTFYAVSDVPETHSDQVVWGPARLLIHYKIFDFFRCDLQDYQLRAPNKKANCGQKNEKP